MSAPTPAPRRAFPIKPLTKESFIATGVVISH
jgi:hypothetical protein